MNLPVCARSCGLLLNLGEGPDQECLDLALPQGGWLPPPAQTIQAAVRAGHHWIWAWRVLNLDPRVRHPAELPPDHLHVGLETLDSTLLGGQKADIDRH